MTTMRRLLPTLVVLATVLGPATAHAQLWDFVSLRKVNDRLAGRVETLRIAQQIIHRTLDHQRPAIEAQIRLGMQLHGLLRDRHRRILLHCAEQGIELDVLRARLIGINPGQGQDLADQ